MPKLFIDGTTISRSPKGVGRYSYHLCDQLCRKLPENWSIEVLIYNDCVGVLDQLKRCQVNYHQRVNEFVKGIYLLPRLLRVTQADLLLRPNDCLGINYAVPTMTVCHDIDQYIRDAQAIVKGQREGVVRRCIDKCKEVLIGYSLRHSDIVFCNSEFVRSAVCRYYHVDIDKTRISYCAVDPRFYEISRNIQNGIQNNIHKGLPEKYILTFATGDYRENFFQIPIIANILKKKSVDTTFVIAGINYNDLYYKEIEYSFDKFGLKKDINYFFVEFMGEENFNKLVSLYTLADFYLDTSLHEGFGMQVIEAMACGTPCIVSSKGALPEICSGYAYHVDPNSPENIAETIRQAYSVDLHNKDNMKQVNYTRKFNWDNVGSVVCSEINKYAFSF